MTSTPRRKYGVIARPISYHGASVHDTALRHVELLLQVALHSPPYTLLDTCALLLPPLDANSLSLAVVKTFNLQELDSVRPVVHRRQHTQASTSMAAVVPRPPSGVKPAVPPKPPLDTYRFSQANLEGKN